MFIFYSCGITLQIILGEKMGKVISCLFPGGATNYSGSSLRGRKGRPLIDYWTILESGFILFQPA